MGDLKWKCKAYYSLKLGILGMGDLKWKCKAYYSLKYHKCARPGGTYNNTVALKNKISFVTK